MTFTLVTFLVAGTAAMRNTKRGSWYIEALTQVFCQRACDMHVADMLVKVSPSGWLCEPFAHTLPPRCPTFLLPALLFAVSTLPVAPLAS